MLLLSPFIFFTPHVFKIPYHLFARILLLQQITNPLLPEFRMGLVHVYKDSLTLTYPTNFNIRLVLQFEYPMVGSFDTINDVDWYYPCIHLYNNPTIALRFHVHHYFYWHEMYWKVGHSQVSISKHIYVSWYPSVS
jgi:hypothetical protein